MKKWLHGWAVTLRIISSRGLYRSLTAHLDPADFVEVDEPRLTEMMIQRRVDNCCPLFEDNPYE